MVVCRMTLMVCKKKRSAIEKKTKWWKLKKEECCEEFREKLRQALGGQVVLPDDWETTAEVIRETGRKVLGVSSRRSKEDKETWWWNEEVQDSIRRKRLAKNKWDMDRTDENRQEYKESQRRVKRKVSKAKQKAYDELYTILDTREGQKDLYGLARQRDQDGKDVQQVLFYLDDLVIFGNSLEEHENRLLWVLDRLKEDRLKVSAGFCGYYHWFIADYAKFAKPLWFCALTAFRQIVQCLTTAPILAFADLKSEGLHMGPNAVKAATQESKNLITSPEPIFPPSAILAPVQWNLVEDVQRAHAENRPLATCPPSKLYVPAMLCHRVMKWIHEAPSSGHPGIHCTAQLKKQKFWWPSLDHDVENFVKSCAVCAQSCTNPQLPEGLLRPLPIPQRPWSHISINFITDLPNSGGFTTILVAIDRFSKACKLIPLKGLPTAMETAKVLFHHVFRNFGLPEDIISDQGAQFTSQMWRAFCTRLGINYPPPHGAAPDAPNPPPSPEESSVQGNPERSEEHREATRGGSEEQGEASGGSEEEGKVGDGSEEHGEESERSEEQHD
ncbi:hypothetical protein QTP70_006176 [Hemibagrus guttatus]|uniref:Gypsy retrotransposon integrase-like protein 1 n=1 Tax=Hemibagrus guttatus TaxID=175788 RepID=A0AAE0QSY3_9TELE|nr:hypothetical protein QTP70_006176 [Hemibagrus guttatus]